MASRKRTTHICVVKQNGIGRLAAGAESGMMPPAIYMLNGNFLTGRRRSSDSSDGREQRAKRFVRLALFFGLILALLFGLILYSMNVSRRI